MRTQIEKIINLKSFFKIIQSTKDSINCSLERPSQIILQNVHINWLLALHTKTYQNFPIYLSKHVAETKPENVNLKYGYINNCLPKDINEVFVQFDDENCTVDKDSKLEFNVTVPQQDVMQYFTQWQRYRKYWWSSITTTPGLFSVADMICEDENTNANISANFNWGQWIVETVKVVPNQNNLGNNMTLCCSMSLENSLIAVLLDATINSTKEKYLRLHNKIAPYKISFALNSKDQEKCSTLQELATLICYKLQSNKISTMLPKFSLPLETQIKENLRIGVIYTAVLSDDTLSNGIFHLMNSSTMLKEQVHIADFVKYAALLCGQRTIDK